jgi:hypothetical protein
MSMYSRLRLLYKIDARPDGPSHARRIVIRELAPVMSRRACDEIKLMVSELVTDGVMHGRRDSDVKIMLDLRVDDGVRCAVTTNGHGFAGGGAMNRAALRIFERLASRWGVQRTRQGARTTWFETEPVRHHGSTR